MVHLRGKQTDVLIIEVYMPASDYSDNDVEDVYEKIEDILNAATKSKDYSLIMGDWNAVVGESKEERYVGHYGSGIRNAHGEKLVEFCQRWNLYIASTWFCQDKHRRYTWTSPAENGRYQTDYVVAKWRFWNGISNAKTYPGADINSDHNPVVTTLRIELKKVLKVQRKKVWNIDKLTDDITATEYQGEVNIALDGSWETGDWNDRWERFKDSVTHAANKA